MKTVIYSSALILLFVAQTATAVTCKVLEADGKEVSATTKHDAEKLAWEACIDNKVAQREHRDGKVTVEAALDDAEPCINSKLVCR